MNQLITYEDFTSVQELQAGATKLFLTAAKNNKFYRVMRNKSPLGVLIPNNLWLSLVKNLEEIPTYTKAKKEKVKKSWGIK